MKRVNQLNFGFSDAVNYRAADAQPLLNLFFVEDDQVSRVCEPQISFLVGEKGTGKTACAAFLSGGTGAAPHRASCKTVFLMDNDYDGLLDLAHRKGLPEPSYPQIWKLVLLLVLIDHVRRILPEAERPAPLVAAAAAIDQFFANAFNGEVFWALQLVSEAPKAAQCFAATAGTPLPEAFDDAGLLPALLFAQRSLLASLTGARDPRRFIIFIDGIDVRPPRMQYEDFIKSVKALVNAVWSVNEELSHHSQELQAKFVLLVRPDILDTVGMQNLNNRMRDNAVMLDWQTTYQNYRHSKLFQLADKMLSSQQRPEALAALAPGGTCWDYYFPYKVWNNRQNAQTDSSFIPFLRSSFYRPRDITTYLEVMRGSKVERGQGDGHAFTRDDFDESMVRRRYSEYLLGEVKDSLQFYYAADEYELFLKFFAYLAPSLTGDEFTYESFQLAYADLMDYIRSSAMDRPVIFQSADRFLQFLYELNIICFIEPNDFHARGMIMRWCFRERSCANMRPKVRSGLRYKMHYGIARALNAARGSAGPRPGADAAGGRASSRRRPKEP